MTCPVCFFREDHQKLLKASTFGIDRFENKLKKYKGKFIEDICQMDSLSNCSCLSAYSHNGMISWMDSFLHALKRAEGEVRNAFDSIISVYEDFINKSQVAPIRSSSLDQRYCCGGHKNGLVNNAHQAVYRLTAVRIALI